MKVELIELPSQNLANCWLITDEKSGKSALCDIGWFYDEVKNYLCENHIDLQYILLTHGHFDHVCGAAKCKEYTGAKIVIHKDDERGLREKEVNLMDDFAVDIPLYPVYGDILVGDGDEITLGESVIKVMHTPGHSEGSVCYIDEKGRNILSGDTVFCSTVGRTDINYGSEEKLRKSIEKFLTLEGEYDIYPGHSIKTTMSHERVRNIYIRRMNRK